MTNLPYSPTRVLPAPDDDGIFYIFQPPTAIQSGAELLALNVSASKTFDGTSLPISTLSNTLPFNDGDAYIPVTDGSDRLMLYTGDCKNTKDGSTIWRFEGGNETSKLQGTWTQANVLVTSDAENAGPSGANYLASAIAFSPSAESSFQMYVFGGICPNVTGGSSGSEWTGDAKYSNSMLVIEPAGPSVPETYMLSVSSSRGPPIPEAGFTMTPLEPTTSPSATDNENQHRNQIFVLLGGHTQTAFINMSQVALFSLPEQTWSFIPVDPPSDSPKTDLAARDSAMIDPRSGHTAVLTPDGQRIVVFGGWVGDVRTAADPQLAVLELGSGYGGNGDWHWTIPSPNGLGPNTSSGLYGHGATMLPGDVMMITGGYVTSGTNMAKSRRSDFSMNTNVYFLNTTSNAWMSTYTHPETPSDRAGSADTKHLTGSKRVGLGAGLTFGVLAIIAIIVVYFWYSKRLKRRQDAREDELRHLGFDAHRSHSSMLRAESASQPVGDMMTKEACTLAQGCSERPASRHNRDAEAERTGLLFEIPSPTRGLRRSLHSRGNYQPAPWYDDNRLARGSGNIHPIDERDEYDDEHDVDVGLSRSEVKREDCRLVSSAPVLDPFRDPDMSRTPSPQSPARERELEQQKWVNDWAAADALMHQRGRQSPDKTDRTSSSLSDQSARSMVSAQSWQHSVGTISRSMSQRSGALFSARPLSPPITQNTALPSHGVQRTQSMTMTTSPANRRSQSLTLVSNPRRTTTSESILTIAPSFTQLQSEGEALLGGFQDRSPTRTQSRAREFMGSIRRVFTGTDRSASASPENGDLSASSSPTKCHHHGDPAGLPRRAASTGAMLWQKRQGARDWNAHAGSSQGEVNPVQEGRDADDEEWDVESAVERRVVQVMFTVPKEKLRVVNRGPDGDGISVVSRDGSVRTGKEKGNEDD